MRLGNPLADLHRHMDGNLRLQTIIDIAKRCDLDLPAWEPETLRPFAQVQGQEADLVGFLKKFDLIQSVIADYEAIRQIARDNVADAHAEGIDYLELRFSPFFMAEKFNLDVHRIVETVCDEVTQATKVFDVQVSLIVIMCRNLGIENCYRELAAAIAYKDQGVVGIDLAGDEYNFAGDLFVDHFKKARDAGLHVTVHAGEARGPESVCQAITELGAERIGHGIRAIEDPAAIDLLIERNVTLEICPTSNVQTNTVKGLSNHPLKDFMRAGVSVTLNTDDPGVSGIDLAHEYRIAGSELGLSEEDLAAIQANGIQRAFGTYHQNG